MTMVYKLANIFLNIHPGLFKSPTFAGLKFAERGTIASLNSLSCLLAGSGSVKTPSATLACGAVGAVTSRNGSPLATAVSRKP